MPTEITVDLVEELERLRAQMAEMRARMEALEGPRGNELRPSIAPVYTAPAKETITEEELLAISAAIGAYLGVRPHIKQIRLLSSNAWAQQGRVSIQASHQLQG